MNSQMTTAQIMIAFVLWGITLEVLWTAILNFIETKNPKLTSETYLWMIPVYAFVPCIYCLNNPQFFQFPPSPEKGIYRFGSEFIA